MSLHLDRLSVRLPDGRALFTDLDLMIRTGQVMTITGPSGVGKSTLLDAVGGHLARSFQLTGRVLLDGRDVTDLPPEARGIGVMFQQAVLFPHLSVADNLAFGLSPAIRGRSARHAAVAEALRHAGLDGMGARDPATLSGGQRARAALMRTMLARPRAVLLDEPFSSLDPERRHEIRRFVLATIRDSAIPALLVTHDPQEADAAGGPVIALT
ncbi:MAG: ATP-binding cassette domain-containing protein [Paracoccus sp.]|nr:ATP-binding cassette domain-containing protein [Paracoccus sp. (in: a-proteobacteria)]